MSESAYARYIQYKMKYSYSEMKGKLITPLVSSEERLFHPNTHIIRMSDTSLKTI